MRTRAGLILGLFCSGALLFSQFPAAIAAPVVVLEDSPAFNTRAGYSIRSISTIDEVPVGTIMPWPVSGIAIPYSWLPCDGRAITMSAFSRMPEQWIRDKWYKHAIDTIGGVTPNYNYSARTPNGEGVFLRGKWGGDYSQEFDDSFRSHNHKQQAHTHPITMNVEDGRANGKFDGQEYVDFFARRSRGGRLPFGTAPNMEGTKSYQRHLAAVGGESGLRSHQVVGDTVSGFTFPIKDLATTIQYIRGSGGCSYYSPYDGWLTDSHPFENGDMSVPSGKILPTASSFTFGPNGRNANIITLFDGQSTLTVEGRYKGTLDDPTVRGNIALAGGDTSYTNQNVHGGGETKDEEETAPVNAEVMYIIKIHP